MQLYAAIKPTSEYAHQQQGETRFKVRLLDSSDNYIVIGGVGGRYRLEDVTLYVKRKNGAFNKLVH